MCVLNLRSLAKLVNYQLDIVKMAGSPVVASAVMGAVTYFVYRGCLYLIHSNIVSTLIAVLVAVIVYAMLMIITHGVTEEELYAFPKGDAIVRFLYRMHLL